VREATILFRPLPLLVAMLVLAACQATGESDIETQDVVTQVPWSDGEHAAYDLVDDDGDPAGAGSLSIAIDHDQVFLNQDFADDEGNRDCWMITAGASDVKPVEVERFIVQVDDDEEDRVQITARYAGDFVESVFSADGESRTEDGEVPQNSYDSLSEVFLLRTLAFEEDREFAFNSVFAARPDGRDVDVDVVIFEVEGRETIEVPLGEFDAWRVEIRGGVGQDRTAWVAIDEPHQLLRYDLDFLVYELTDYAAPEPPPPDSSVLVLPGPDCPGSERP
jgi:Protein of unknown function (DUF3108)